jgi:transcriptional regulator with XRE-family HTH domain
VTEGIRLQEIRERQFLTQQELADLAGVAKVTIARIETGVTRPSFATIRKLAAALGVEPAEIVPDPAALRRGRRRESGEEKEVSPCRSQDVRTVGMEEQSDEGLYEGLYKET